MNKRREKLSVPGRWEVLWGTAARAQTLGRINMVDSKGAWLFEPGCFMHGT